MSDFITQLFVLVIGLYLKMPLERRGGSKKINPRLYTRSIWKNYNMYLFYTMILVFMLIIKTRYDLYISSYWFNIIMGFYTYVIYKLKYINASKNKFILFFKNEDYANILISIIVILFTFTAYDNRVENFINSDIGNIGIETFRIVYVIFIMLMFYVFLNIGYSIIEKTHEIPYIFEVMYKRESNKMYVESAIEEKNRYVFIQRGENKSDEKIHFVDKNLVKEIVCKRRINTNEDKKDLMKKE